MLIAVAPLFITLGTVWVRDVPECEYHYLDQTHPILPYFPRDNSTPADKVERMWWLVSARQYDYMFHPTWRTIEAQANWPLTEFGARHRLLMVLGLGVVAVGAATLWSHNRAVAVFLVLMIPSGIISILLVRVVSHTTILSSVLFAVWWLFGLGFSRILRWHRCAAWNVFIPGCMGFAVWWTADTCSLRKQVECDARDFIEGLNLEALPPNATLLGDFDMVAPRYVQNTKSIRPGIEILFHYGRLDRRFLETNPGRVLTTEHPSPEDRVQLVGSGAVREIRLRDAPSPSRGLWI